MSAARIGLYNLLRSDAVLMALGAGTGSDDDLLTVFPNYALDSPAAHLTRWVTLRWGAAEAPPGRDTATRPMPVAIWVYDRERDFTNIDSILRRCRTIMAGIQGLPLSGGGHLTAADFSFSSEDIWDDSYAAVARGETYRLVTNGL